MEIAAAEASNLRTAIRPGVNASGVRLFSRYNNPSKSSLLEQWETEHRPWAMSSNILVGGELILTGCVVQENDVFGPKDIMKNRTG